MGLFTKKEKPPCAICGGKVSGFLPWSIEGQLVCDACYGVVNLPKGSMDNMTLEKFKEYMAYREENDQRKQRFQATREFDFGWFDDKLLFDTEHRLMCMDKKLKKPVYEGSQVISFEIREDQQLLFSGNAEGLVCYTSDVPQRARALEPQIEQFRMRAAMRREMAEMIEESRRKDGEAPRYYSEETIDLPELFKKFLIEIHFDDPYWTEYKGDKNGPEFSYSDPSVEGYLELYNGDVQLMRELAEAIMEVAFPGAPERTVTPVGVADAVSGAASAVGMAAGTAEELIRLKELVDKGILTEEEFTAKKRQILGI